MLLASQNSSLEFSTGLEIVGTSGAMGGMVAAVYALADGGRTKDGKYSAAKGVPVLLFLTARCLVGFGGASAVLFAALSVNKFNGASDVDLLSLAALLFCRWFYRAPLASGGGCPGRKTNRRHPAESGTSPE